MSPSSRRVSSGKLACSVASSHSTTSSAVTPFSKKGERLSAAVANVRERLGDSYVDRDELQFYKTIGEGSFATVQLAVYQGKIVAVKSLHATMFSDEKEVLSFLHEVLLLKNIRHDHIVTFLGAGGIDLEPCDIPGLAGQPLYEDLYLVQEYCSGGSLNCLLAKQMCDPFKWMYGNRKALQWCLEIASALHYLHLARPKIIHRDMKLDNILLTSQDIDAASVKLADFGLAKLMHHTANAQKLQGRLELSWGPGVDENPEGLMSGRSHQHKHFDGAFALPKAKLAPQVRVMLADCSFRAAEMTGRTGSFTYMAPEVIRNEQYNEKADVFSFAMVMYNLFHRTLPSACLMANGTPDDIEEYAKEIARGYRPPLGKHTVVPETIKDIITMCWRQNPEDRPSMKEVVGCLVKLQLSGLDSGGDSEGPSQCGCTIS